MCSASSRCSSRPPRTGLATLADLELYGLCKDYIEGYGPALAKVDLAETAAVTADAFPRPADLVIVLIGDAAKIREVRSEVRPVSPR